MAANILPLDDLELEMEEVEGLIELSTVGGGRRNKSSFQSSNAVIGAVAGGCSSKYRSRWGCCALILLTLVLMAIWMTDTKDLKAAEGEGGSHVSDVEDKNMTHVETTLSPTKAPTANPTTPPPTAAPVTPFPTASPKTPSATASPKTPSPTAQPTVVSTPQDKQGAKDAEGEGGSHVSDVEDKNMTHVETTLSPTKASTAKPVAATSPPPTAAPVTPSPAASPKPPSPTAPSITLSPTAQPTVVASSQEKQGAKDNTVSDAATPSPSSATTQPPVAENATQPKAKSPSPTANESPKPAKVEPATRDTSAGYAFPETPFAVRTENPPSPAVLEKYSKEWGTWTLDLREMDRDAFCGNYAHCDVPQDKFPEDAWQADADYVSKFLEEADNLVDRAMNAILAEYGKTPTETEMFDLTYRDNLKRRELKGPPDNGGWTTKRSMQGLSRRLIHAIMTRDTFTFIMGGHSAAAGHG